MRIGYWAPLAAFMALQTGCLTARTLAHTKPHDCRYAAITRVTGAVMTGTDLFIEFQGKPLDGEGEGTRVLRIPLNSSAWLHDERGKPVAPSDARIDGTQVHQVAEWFLLPESAMPEDGKELSVTSVEIEDLRKLPDRAADVPDDVQVLWVKEGVALDRVDPSTGETISSFAATGAPLLAILSRPDSKKWQTTLIVANVCKGCQENRAWYALTPVAIVGDVITFPFVAIAVLLWPGE